MSLVNLSLLSGATCSATGGTAYPFSPSGKSLANGYHLIDAAQADIRIQPSIQFVQKFPVRQPDNTWSLWKQETLLTIPKLCADGIVRAQRLRIQRETLAEGTAAEKLALVTLGAQLLFDADVTAFYASGSVA